MPPRQKKMVYLSLADISIEWAKGDGSKNSVNNMKMPEVFTNDSFFILQQSFRVFPIGKLDYYPLNVT